MSAGDAERLGLLEDEIWNATDRLSRSEAKAVAHSVYNGDWLAAHDAGVAAAARREGAAEALAPIKALRDQWGALGDTDSAFWWSTLSTHVTVAIIEGHARADRVAAAPHEEQP